MVILRFVRSNQWLGSDLNICQGLVIVVIVIVVVVVVVVIMVLRSVDSGVTAAYRH